jgi:ribosome modulation factor
MVKTGLRSLAFFAALGITPVVVSPVVMHAQQVNEDQRAYQVGYQNGVNAARANRPMNMSTDDWHGDRVNFYQQGYQAGYNSVRGGGERDGQYAKDPERQRAYQTGYQNGVNAAERNRPMNANTDDWHGDRLQAYQEGYEHGYHSVGGDHHHDDHDDH